MVSIIGMGIASALGVGTTATLRALQGEEDHLRPARHCPTSLAVPVGEVDDAALRSALHGEEGRLSRTSLLAQVAAAEAWSQTGLSDTERRHAAVISATTVGGMDQTPKFYEQYVQDPTRGRLKYVREHECASSTDWISGGNTGVRTTISTACSSSANAIMTGARLIEHGLADVAICGGADSLSQFTMAGFNSLQLLSPEKCRPLSAERQGLNLGEGAAYVVLARQGLMPEKEMATLTGWANANDAHHQTAISADGRGAQDSMHQAMQMAGLTPDDIDYVNLHGTATQNNDASELAAMQAVWSGHQMPAFSSTKAFTGHTLAAAGAIEAIFCIMALRTQSVWANLRFGTPILPWATPATHTTSRTVRHAMSNSLGFGGNCTTLIFSLPQATPTPKA